MQRRASGTSCATIFYATFASVLRATIVIAGKNKLTKD
jgi:hypothetical protein